MTHIRLDTMEELKEKFRNLDVLLIDDIQSLAKKTLSGTQEEFFNTFNTLYDNNKQIVLTSDRTPDHLDNLEQRLVTRFKWGLTINITPPDFETRVAILTNKTQEYDYVFPQDTIEYLAGQFDSNVRDLEGALNDISLVASVKKSKPLPWTSQQKPFEHVSKMTLNDRHSNRGHSNASWEVLRCDS